MYLLCSSFTSPHWATGASSLPNDGGLPGSTYLKGKRKGEGIGRGRKGRGGEEKEGEEQAREEGMRGEREEEGGERKGRKGKATCVLSLKKVKTNMVKCLDLTKLG